MGQLNPAIITDKQLAHAGFRAAEAAFDTLDALELLWHDRNQVVASLYLLVGEIVDDRFVEIGHDTFGPSAEQYAVNVSPQTGKIATVLEYRMDSREAAIAYGLNADPDDPRGWTGGVILTAKVRLADGTVHVRTFAGAASGVQGEYDESTIRTVLSVMASGWMLRVKAQANQAD